MATVTQSRRVTRRYAVRGSAQARVEFVYPLPGGRRYDLPLIDISVSGLSFDAAGVVPEIDSGTSLGGAVVRLGKCEIRGDLLVMHVTPDSGSATLCGALFYPAHDADLLKLKSAIAGIAAVTGD